MFVFMEKKMYVLALILFFVVIGVAFIYSFYGTLFPFGSEKEVKNGPIGVYQGLIVGDPDALLYDYRANLELDNIVLPEGSVGIEQVLLLSSLYMQSNGNNMEFYSLNKKARRKDQGPAERFQVFFDEKKNYWLVSYIKTNDVKSICDVTLKPDGTLIGIDCKDS
jgi:hypothetical protein